MRAPLCARRSSRGTRDASPAVPGGGRGSVAKRRDGVSRSAAGNEVVRPPLPRRVRPMDAPRHGSIRARLGPVAATAGPDPAPQPFRPPATACLARPLSPLRQPARYCRSASPALYRHYASPPATAIRHRRDSCRCPAVRLPPTRPSAAIAPAPAYRRSSSSRLALGSLGSICSAASAAALASALRPMAFSTWPRRQWAVP